MKRIRLRPFDSDPERRMLDLRSEAILQALTQHLAR